LGGGGVWVGGVCALPPPPPPGRSALQAAEEGAEPGQHAVTGLADLDLAVG
jgi:hypothetical protein